MSLGSFRFGEFRFEPGERLLFRGEERLDLSGRYLDALALLLRERGRLVTKDRFMEEVWQGLPVTDEALTQCIRSLRRQLGDDAARPRFIETVPKHGYRFIAEAAWADGDGNSDGGMGIGTAKVVASAFDWRLFLRTSAFSGLGGAVAGIGGGLFYGLAASPTSAGEAIGGISVLLVLLAISVLLGLAAGSGVGSGIAAAASIPGDGWQWGTCGGMLGGLFIGGVARLLGLDAFALFFGGSQFGMTGPAEGAVLGAALGFVARLAARRRLPLGKSAAVGGLAGGMAGLLVALCGGHLLGGSLHLLAQRFPEARFQLDGIGLLLGESGFGPVSEALTATGEGALFGLGVAGALVLARKRAAA